MNKKGFTLIELLVVVLIIGILAGIALPQYQMAVEKSRASEALINMKAIIDAVERSVLIHGNENFDATHSHENWDMELTGGHWYNRAVNSYGDSYLTDNFIYGTDDDPTGIYAIRCSGKCQESSNPWSNEIYDLWGCLPSIDGPCPFLCFANTDKGKRICKALEGLGVENRS